MIRNELGSLGIPVVNPNERNIVTAQASVEKTLI